MGRGEGTRMRSRVRGAGGKTHMPNKRPTLQIQQREDEGEQAPHAACGG